MDYFVQQRQNQMLGRAFFVLAAMVGFGLFLLASPVWATPATITDTTTGSANNDGTVNPGEYVGFTNGINSGFGDFIGVTSQLHVDSSHTGALNFGLISGGGAFNDLVVIYIDTDNGATGFADTGGFTDFVDPCRIAISGNNGTTSSTLTFATGFRADHAICISPAFSGVWELVNPSSHTFVTGLTRNAVAPNHHEIDLTMANLGLTPGDSFRYVVTYLSNTAFRSNEFHGVATGNFPANIGQNPVTLPDGSFITFNSCGNLVTNTTTSETFCTIQDAINATNTENGHTLNISTGTYLELIDVTKSVTLAGEAGVVIHPSENVRNITDANDGAVIRIRANDVVIRDLEIDGDNPDIGGGYDYGGADINAATGILKLPSTLNGTHVENVTLRNVGFGVELYGGQDHVITRNTLENLGGLASYGYGVLLFNNISATITENNVDGTSTAGIFMQQNSSSNPTLIADNTVSNTSIGLGWNVLSGGATGTVEGNTVSNVTTGMQATSISNGSLTVRNNTFTLPTGALGFSVWNTAPGLVLITENTVTGGDVGVFLRDAHPTFGNAEAHLQLTNNNFSGTVTAIDVLSDSGDADTEVTLRATGNSIANGTVGLAIAGSAATENIVFAGNTVGTTATPFVVSAAGNNYAYANNITGFTTGVNNTGGSLNAGHNWWGAHDPVPASVNDTNAFDYRLGAAVSSWSDAGALGDASLTTAGGSGTPVIVSHGRGLAKRPL
jgi:hypothetical protein